jgi:formyl-CoA transferase
MPVDTNARPRPLDELLVIDLTQFIAGPYCTMLLADAGARVIKVEPPGRGEAYRREGPALGDQPTGGYLMRVNRNKESVTLDLATAGGRRVLERLAERADVLVENFKHDSMDRLGLGWERLRELNPRLVYASISGFGHTDLLPGPYAHWPAFAIVAEAMGGVMDRIGEPSCEPHWSGVSLGDIFASTLCVSGILMAIQHRAKTDSGQHVDISMHDGMVSLNERALYLHGSTGVSLGRGSEGYFAPFGSFQAADGWIAIGVVGNAIWRRFCAAIDRPDLAADERLAEGRGRAVHAHDIVRPAIAAWLATRTRQEATDALVAHDVPAGLVQTAAEVAADPQVAAREMLVEFEYPGAGRQRVAGNPIKLGADLGQPVRRPPLLGEHTEPVLRELLSLDDSELQALRDEGAI